MKNILTIVMLIALSGACTSVMDARRNSIASIQENHKKGERVRYRALVRAKVRRSLKSPFECKGSGVVKFAVKIDDSGNITHLKHVGDPNGQDCISNVEQAIRAAAPFPMPPDSLYDEAIHEGFIIRYDFEEFKEWKPPVN